MFLESVWNIYPIPCTSTYCMRQHYGRRWHEFEGASAMGNVKWLHELIIVVARTVAKQRDQSLMMIWKIFAVGT
jgi:hypothetical protein